MTADSSQKWLMIIAAPVFAAIVGLLVLAIASANNAERMQSILSTTISQPANVVVDCLEIDTTRELNLRRPRRKWKINANPVVLQNPVWHIQVYVTDLGKQARLEVFARNGKITAKQMTAIQICTGSDW
jgi:hypothetical protein